VPTAAKTLLITLILAVCLAGSAKANCPAGDLTGDCQVNLEDLQIFTELWLDPNCLAPDCPADLDGIPGVNMSDLALLTKDWLTTGQITGLLQVIISPQRAVTAGAQWRVNGGNWQNSGSILNNLPVGSHTVQFSVLNLWVKPADQIAVVTNDEATIAYGNYTPVLVINEFMASNSIAKKDPAGEYDDWIEIYNAGDTPINVAGMYLTKDLDTPTMWRFPSNNPSLTTIAPRDPLDPNKGHLLVWADNDTGQAGLHATFKIDADNDKELGLFYTDGWTLIDSISFGKQTTDVSYGRSSDANNTWQFMGKVLGQVFYTPGYKNKSGYVGTVADTKFSHNRGFYDTPFSVMIATDTNGASIYYTLDGSAPFSIQWGVPTGTKYTGPIDINTTTTLRAVGFKTAWKPTNMDAQTYIFLNDVIKQATDPVTGAQVVPAGYPTIWPSSRGSVTGDYQMDPDIVKNPPYNSTIKSDLQAIPTVSLVMNRDDLFGSTGIYINESQDGTERAASMEFIDPCTAEEFQINCGVQMQGGISGQGTSLDRWKTYKLSIRPVFKSAYGPAQLLYPVFGQDAADKFDTLVLKNPLNNVWSYGGGVTVPRTPTLTQRDVAQYTREESAAYIQNAMGGYSKHTKHVHLYLNGLYWGLYCIHERPDEHFAASYLGGDANDYDVLKHSSSLIVNGSNTNYIQMFNVANAGLASDSQYQLIQQYLDVPNFIDYMLMNFYVGNTDWAMKNWYASRNRVDPNGRWRYHSWDAEHIFESLNADVTGKDDSGNNGPTHLHQKLTANTEYRMLFADHVHRYFFNNGLLTPAGAAALYQIRLNEVDRAVVGESARWGDNQRSTPYTRDVEWVTERNWLLNTYFPQRTAIVLTQLKTKGLYPIVDAPVFYINGSYKHGGYISPTDQLSMTAPVGTIYYTTDGNDPRLPGGTTNPGASIFVAGTTQVTLVTGNAAKRVKVPTAAISDNWRGGGTFDDSTWTSVTGSPGGVGYDRNTGSGGNYLLYVSSDVNALMNNLMYNKNATCYIRIPFTVNAGDLGKFNSMTLNMLYDDGFVAYINGTEVKRMNISVAPQWNSSTGGITRNAGTTPEPFDISSYLYTLQVGNNILAIHGLNSSTTGNDFLITAELVGTISNVQPISLNKSTHVKSRVLSGSTWSALNEAIFAVGPVAENLRITEIMYHPEDTDDPNDPNEEFIELKNIGTQALNLNLVQFTNGIDFTFLNLELAGGQYVVVVKNRAAFNAQYPGFSGIIAGQYTGWLENAGERIRLEDALGGVILDFEYKDGWRDITDGNGFSLTIINPADPNINHWGQKDYWRASAYWGGSPGWNDNDILPNPGAVVINEVLAHSHAGAPDWIELYNTTNSPINIGNWYLSDSGSNLKKYKIAAGTSIPQNGYKVFYEDTDFNDVTDPGCLVPFALSENGDTVYLSSAEPDGVLTGYRDVEDFGASLTDVSFGRYHLGSTGNYNFVAMSAKTLDGSNAYPKVGPIVINEIMYNPDWPEGGSYSNDEYEYIELRNISASSVTLYDSNENLPWKFTNGIEYTFPASPAVTIQAGGYIVVVRNKTAFGNRYPSVPSGKIYGPYSGHLNNGGESLELSQPGDVDEFGERHYIRVDRVNYSDGSHPQDCPGGVDLWPVEPDGWGKSLSRKVSSAYGNDPNNWTAAAPSPVSNNP